MLGSPDGKTDQNTEWLQGMVKENKKQNQTKTQVNNNNNNTHTLTQTQQEPGI